MPGGGEQLPGWVVSCTATVWYGSMVWYGMVEVCEGAPVAVSGWVLTDRHDSKAMCS